MVTRGRCTEKTGARYIFSRTHAALGIGKIDTCAYPEKIASFFGVEILMKSPRVYTRRHVVRGHINDGELHRDDTAVSCWLSEFWEDPVPTLVIHNSHTRPWAWCRFPVAPYNTRFIAEFLGFYLHILRMFAARIWCA